MDIPISGDSNIPVSGPSPEGGARSKEALQSLVRDFMAPSDKALKPSEGALPEPVTREGQIEEKILSEGKIAAALMKNPCGQIANANLPPSPPR